jgi:hypothetical protein
MFGPDELREMFERGLTERRLAFLTVCEWPSLHTMLSYEPLPVVRPARSLYDELSEPITHTVEIGAWEPAWPLRPNVERTTSR